MSVEQYMQRLIVSLKQQFACRLVYVGLQGSYARGEATADSDIDVMVVLDALSVSDLADYRRVIKSLPNADKSCGFICGKADLANWNPLEIAQLVHTTEDYVGTLCDLVPTYTTKDIRTFIKLSVNNLYHGLCHGMIHGAQPQQPDHLMQSYKNVFFILQNLYYLTCGRYVATKAELMGLADGKDRAVLQRAVELKEGVARDFDESFLLLFTWCQELLQSI